MKNLLFTDEEVSFAMRKGVMDLLTVIPVEHLEKGVTFVFCMILDFLKELYSDDEAKYRDAKRRWNDDFFESYFL